MDGAGSANMVPVYVVSFTDGAAANTDVFLSRKDSLAFVDATPGATMQPGLGLTVWQDGATSASEVMLCHTETFQVSGNQNFYSDDVAAQTQA